MPDPPDCGSRSRGHAGQLQAAEHGLLHHAAAKHYRAEMTVRFAIWDQITGAADWPTTA